MRYPVLLISLSFFTLSGCQMTKPTVSLPTISVTAETESIELEQPEPALENSPIPADKNGESEDMTQFDSHPHVFKAKDDLANRTNIPFDQIEVVSVQMMTWPDSSMGCPQPDMVYTQVLHDGLLIQLQANGFNYNYHSGGNRDPFLCIQTNKSKEPSIKLDPSMGLTPFVPDLDK